MAWYSRHCDGDWEHGYGFKIETLDNPGVSLDAGLRETELETVPFAEIKRDYGTDDRWMICRRTEDRFETRGAPSRLTDMIEEFLRWADAHAAQPPRPGN